VGVTRAVCAYVRDVDGAPASRVELIYNCANPDYFPLARRAPDPNVAPHLLMVGRLTPVKNHETLLRALVEVVRRRPDVKLSIVGDGPLQASTAALIERLELKQHVTLHGFRSDVRDMLAQSRGFLLPSLSEGCSVSLIEAMATGVPALGSSVPGIAEVLGEELSAKFTTGATAVADWSRLMLALLELSPAAWQAYATQAQARAYEMFSPVAYVERVEGLYQRLAERKLRGRLAGASTAVEASRA
jgi:glycosyltransferase involved in cell wall biosynthesis